MDLKIGNNWITAWWHPPQFSMGLNLELSRDRPTWFMLPFAIILIRRYKLKDPQRKLYVSDINIEKAKFGKVTIMEHIEPEGNKNYFNLGFTITKKCKLLFFGRYEMWI